MGKSGGQVKIFEERWTKQMQEKAEKRVEMLKKRVKRCVCKSCGGKLSLRQLDYNEFEDARIEIFCDNCDRLEFGIEPEIYTSAQYYVDEFIYCNPGCYDHLENFEDLKNENIMADYYLFKWKGAKFDSITNSGDRIAGFTITGNTMEEMIQKHNTINERIRVISTDGKDMMRHDLLTEL